MLATPAFSERVVETARKYNRHAFMYVEYPHKSSWRENFREADQYQGLETLARTQAPLLLYVHFPYCTRQCFYCTCHTEIGQERQQWRDYLDLLYREIDLYQRHLEQHDLALNGVEVHLGGGSPTLLPLDDFDALVDRLGSFLDLSRLREFAIEVDPRHTDPERLHHYHRRGINRISLGIQDFDPAVQSAINRVQSLDQIEALLTPDVRALFSHGINFDMLCGLPQQSVDSIRDTFEAVVRLAPERICFNHLHFAPEFSPHQRFMLDGKNGRPDRLPNRMEKRALFHAALEILTEHGYRRMGYDHFARPEDDVSRALVENRMQWNSLGVTAGAYSHVLGVGPHSTSTLYNTYAQNVYGTQAYQQKLEAGQLPLFRGVVLNRDDILRRTVIQTLRNFARLDYGQIEADYDLCFAEYFASSLRKLEGLERDGLVVLSDRDLRVTELGQEFVLHVCACFDAYLERGQKEAGDSPGN